MHPYTYSIIDLGDVKTFFKSYDVTITNLHVEESDLEVFDCAGGKADITNSAKLNV